MHHEENAPCEDAEFFADCIDYEKGAGRTISGAAKIVYSLEASKKLGRLLDKKPADIAHLHSIYHHLSPSVLVELNARGVPSVMTTHDLKLACPNNKMLNRRGICERCKGGKVWNVIFNKCIKDSFLASSLIAFEAATHKALNLYGRYLDRIVTPSRFYSEKLIEWGWDPAKLIHIPNAAAIPGTPPAAPGDYVLYFGRLSQEKGLETLIRAAALAGVSVKLAGTGPQEAHLRAVASDTKAPVEFLGFQSGDALWALVDGARVVVLPSEWYENSPMSAIEAFGRGKPLIGARIGGIPELIIEGETGWLFESGDASALAAALCNAKETSNTLLTEMGAATQAYIKRNHSREGYFNKMRDLYAELGVTNTFAAV